MSIFLYKYDLYEKGLVVSSVSFTLASQWYERQIKNMDYTNAFSGYFHGFPAADRSFLQEQTDP